MLRPQTKIKTNTQDDSCIYGLAGVLSMYKIIEGQPIIGGSWILKTLHHQRSTYNIKTVGGLFSECPLLGLLEDGGRIPGLVGTPNVSELLENIIN